jgi:hypothetical protein
MEPGYENLAKHLRAHPDDHVIAGSYHADARSIEADVDRALRKLRRSHLDVLLLFWSRSPSRVDPAAYAAIARPRALLATELPPSLTSICPAVDRASFLPVALRHG